MPGKAFWLTDFIGGANNALDGIDAEDCLGDASNVKLAAGDAAAVVNGGTVYFYSCKQSASPPVENSPSVIHPDNNLLTGDPLYWQQIVIEQDVGVAQYATDPILTTDTSAYFSYPTTTPYPTLQQVGDQAAPTATNQVIDFNSATEGNFIQEDATKMDWGGSSLRLINEGTGGGTGDHSYGATFTLAAATQRFYHWATTSFVAVCDNTANTLSLYDISGGVGTFVFKQAFSFASYITNISTFRHRSHINVCGNYIFIGDPEYTGSKTMEGRLYVFEFNVSTNQVSLVRTVLSPVPARNGYFGYAASYDEVSQRLIVGEPGVDLARVLTGTPAAGFTSQISITAPSARKDFGQGVAINGGWIAVGAPLMSQNATNAGAVYVYSYTGSAATLNSTIHGLSLDGYLGSPVFIFSDWAIWAQSQGGPLGYFNVYLIRKNSSGTWVYRQGLNIPGACAFSDSEALLTYSSYAYGGTSASGAFYRIPVANHEIDATQYSYQAPAEIIANNYFGHGCQPNISLASTAANTRAFFLNNDGTTRKVYEVLFAETGFYIVGSYHVHQSTVAGLPLDDVSVINSCTISQSEPANTTLRYLASFDNGVTWKKRVSGTTWSVVAGGLSAIESEGNTAADFAAGFASLSSPGGTLRIAVNLERTALEANNQSPSITSVTINYLPLSGSVTLDLRNVKYYNVVPGDESFTTVRYRENSTLARTAQVNMIGKKVGGL